MAGHFGVAGCLAVLAVAVPTAPATAAQLAVTAPPGVTANSVTWSDCPLPPIPTRDPRQRCGVLRVPLDYRAKNGKTLGLAVSRIPAAKPALRRGVLLLNPGGPGAAGLDFPSSVARALPQGVRDRYDLIGFDPRGVGRSTPVSCGLPLDGTTVELVLPYPAPDGSTNKNVAFARETAARCAARSGAILRYLTTANTARDMDQIRRALGEPKLSYLGFSYGTYLGALYATMFAKNTDRMILDSGVDPKLVWYGIWRTWSQAVALRFPDAARYAAGHDTTVGFGKTVDEVTASYLALARRLDVKPVVLSTLGIKLSGNLLREITRGYLYDDSALPTLARVWAEAAGRTHEPGNPALTAALRGQPVLRGQPARSDGQGVPADNSIAALYAVACADVSWQRDVKLYQARARIDRAAWPLTAGMPANVWPCAFWRYRATESPVAITSRGSRNILVLQNRRDPATSWESGLGLRRALGPRAAFVGVDAGGHGVYGWGTCADTAANAFLASGTLPSRDLACTKQRPEAGGGSAPRFVREVR